MFRSLTLSALFVLTACTEPLKTEIAGSSVGMPAAATIPFMPTPDADPFYAQPSPMPKSAVGTILNSREITFSPGGVPQPNSAWQLQYMSTDMHGNPQAAIATVVLPLIPALTGAAPLLSLQFAINSPGLKCAPSHQLAGDNMDNSNTQLETLEYIAPLQALGWTLVFPDHLGPTSSVGVGRIAAPIVLDGIRAALKFQPLGLSADTPVGMMGYSGGALATTWSTALQPAYAPELNIVGVAVGGLPADLEATVKAFDGDPIGFPIAFGAVVSVNRVFPQLLPEGLFTEEGRQVAEAVKDGCLGNTTDGSAGPSGQLADYATVEDVYATAGAREVLPKLKLPQPGEVPTAEMYFYHQMFDQLAPIGPAQNVFDTWCAAGARLHFYADTTGEHYAGAATAVPSELAFLLSRFAGSPVAAVPPTAVSCN